MSIRTNNMLETAAARYQEKQQPETMTDHERKIKQNKTKQKEIKLAEELIGFPQVPFRSRELYFPCNVCKVNQLELVAFKVAQNSVQHFPRQRLWVIITALYQLILQSWYQKTAQSLVNTLVLLSWHSKLQ